MGERARVRQHDAASAPPPRDARSSDAEVRRYGKLFA